MAGARPPGFRYHGVVLTTHDKSPAGQIRGAALHQDGILTWGESLAVWPFDGRPPKILEASTNYGAAGALHPEAGLFLMEGSRLIRHRPRLIIEEDTATNDCLVVTLNGRTGLLYIHQHAQLRFWTPEGTEEIYSIYTPSKQAGLQFADLDGDGQNELFCGNYWLRPSGRRGVAWRLYAMNTYFENPGSALARILYLPEKKGLLWASAERAAWLTPTTDVKQLWHATILDLAGAGTPACWLAAPLVLLGHSRGVHALRFGADGWTARPFAAGFDCVALLARNDSVWAVGTDRPRLIYPLR